MDLKENEVLIGERKFILAELTCTKREALLDMIGNLTFTEVLKSILPLFDSFKSDDREDNNFGQLIQFMLTNENMWGTLTLCLINVLRLGPTIICLSLKDLKDEDHGYVTQNVTINQESSILNKIIEINKLPETLKNFSSLLVTVRSLMKMKNTLT